MTDNPDWSARPPIYPAEWLVPEEINVPSVAVECERCGHLATLGCLFTDCPFKQSDAPRDPRGEFVFFGS